MGPVSIPMEFTKQKEEWRDKFSDQRGGMGSEDLPRFFRKDVLGKQAWKMGSNLKRNGGKVTHCDISPDNR
jgi:hypothetical protein